LGCAGSKITKGINDGDVPIGTKKIVIHTNMTGEEAYLEAAKTLKSRNYIISFADEKIKTITTDYKDLIKGVFSTVSNAKLSINIIGEKDAKITISGMLDVLDSSNDIIKKGQNNSPIRIAWKEVWLTAKAMKGDKMTYE
jgi:hypothetical protein